MCGLVHTFIYVFFMQHYRNNSSNFLFPICYSQDFCRENPLNSADYYLNLFSVFCYIYFKYSAGYFLFVNSFFQVWGSFTRCILIQEGSSYYGSVDFRGSSCWPQGTHWAGSSEPVVIRCMWEWYFAPLCTEFCWRLFLLPAYFR